MESNDPNVRDHVREVRGVLTEGHRSFVLSLVLTFLLAGSHFGLKTFSEGKLSRSIMVHSK